MYLASELKKIIKVFYISTRGLFGTRVDSILEDSINYMVTNNTIGQLNLV